MGFGGALGQEVGGNEGKWEGGVLELEPGYPRWGFRQLLGRNPPPPHTHITRNFTCTHTRNP